MKGLMIDCWFQTKVYFQSALKSKSEEEKTWFRGKNHFQIFGVSGNLEIDFSIDLNKCLRTAIDILESTLYFC